jgi:hypothetical protein
MKRLAALILTLLILAPALYADTEKPVTLVEKNPDYDFNLGMVLWSYFTFNAQNQYANFGLSRLYLKGSKAINDNVGVKFIFEGSLDTSSTGENRWRAAAKEAFMYAKIRTNGWVVRGVVGIIETPYINYFGRVGRDLPYYNDPVQTYSVIPGNDLGIGFGFSYDKLVSFYATVTNGKDSVDSTTGAVYRGYKNLAFSYGNFLYAARLSFTPLQQVIITALFFYDTYDSVAATGVGFYSASVAWKDKMLAGGINWTQEVIGTNSMIIDAWIHYNLKREAGFPMKIYLQYSAELYVSQELNFGIGYEFAPGTNIALFYTNPLQLYQAGSVTLHFTTSF